MTERALIRGVDEIRDAYRDDRVAQQYVDRRFVEPLGALLHARQAGVLVNLIQQHRPRRILEIAPGPARLTVEAARVFRGTGLLIDASRQMLAEAGRRLGPGSDWQRIQGDAFQLPFGATFDLVYSFRLIRHFEQPERHRLYRQITRVLAPGGLLVFDAVNQIVSAPLRQRSAPGEYRHYDAMFTRSALKQELEAARLELVALQGVQHRFAWLQRLQVLVGPRSRPLTRALLELVDRAPGGEPLEWIVVCRRP